MVLHRTRSVRRCFAQRAQHERSEARDASLVGDGHDEGRAPCNDSRQRIMRNILNLLLILAAGSPREHAIAAIRRKRRRAQRRKTPITLLAKRSAVALTT
jgi:hypothetical protein